MLKFTRTLHRLKSDTPISETVRDFLHPQVFYEQLQERGFNFFTGIPDSLFSDFLNYLSEVHPSSHNVITANEGSAIGVASGWHMATRKYPVVFMQSAGVGNAVNPLLSLVDPKVYNIPMLLLIGWRGEPGKKDEPQHKVMGSVTTTLLETAGIRYEILPDYEEGTTSSLDQALQHLETTGSPYAFMVRRRTFYNYESKVSPQSLFPLTREEALEIMVDTIGKFDGIVSTAGFTSRELLSIQQSKEIQNNAFYCVGARGHNASVAFGVALSKPSKTIFCLDGDGSFLMHMGAITNIGVKKPSNFKHIVFNNQIHETAGGLPSVGVDVKFADLASACGYTYTKVVETKEDLIKAINEMKEHQDGASLTEVRIKSYTRHDLRGFFMSPRENKELFMQFLDK